MAGPSTDPVVYPDLSKLKEQTASFQNRNTNNPEQATQLEQFRHLIMHHGDDLVEYIPTRRQHNNDALDLNEELTGLVTSHEILQTRLDTL
ncbi:MAG: hypothetical protein Q9178_007181 [Gyalolechia marmorata]